MLFNPRHSLPLSTRTHHERYLVEDVGSTTHMRVRPVQRVA